MRERRGGEEEEKWDWMKGVVRGERVGGEWVRRSVREVIFI